MTKRTEDAGTAINLSGSFEKWGISPTATLDSARIEFRGLTVQQIKQVLMRIPSTFKASLDVSYREGSDA